MFKKKKTQEFTPSKEIYEVAIDEIEEALWKYRDDILRVESSTQFLEDYIYQLSKIKAYLDSEIKKSREQIRKNHKIASNLSQLIEEN